MDQFFTDQVCLVTGGAQGIGWAIAQALADLGATVFVCDISDEHLLRASQEAGRLPFGARLHFAHCDVTQRAAIEHWIAAAYQQAGRIDVLVNNAAFVRWETVTQMSVEEAELTMQVGYHAMVYSVKAVLPLMQAAGRGHIVNMGSSAGRILVGGSSAAYAAVKAAIDAYTQTLQIELQGTPLHATVVRPAMVAGTDFFRKHVASSQMPRLGDFLPYLTPPQVAEAIVRVLRKPRICVDIPGYLPLLYLLFLLAPGLFRRLINLGGPGRRDYGQVQWQYQVREQRKK
jgi:NAD(P)-dependent dehydrogenase (short-subunit alcohol dehydrogenase family)